MACPTCGHTQQKIAELVFWCPRCGTLSGDGGKSGVTQFWLHEAPKLVERCRAFEGGLRRTPRDVHSAADVFSGLQTNWHSLGIAESINLPAARPAG